MGNQKPKSSENRNEYRTGFLISIFILIAGTILEWVTGGRGAFLPRWPSNIMFGITFMILLTFLHFAYRKSYIIKALSRVPVSVSSIVLFTVLVLLMGLSKQNEAGASQLSKLTGMDHIRNSYTFILTGLYLLTCLGLVTIRRITPFSFKNIGFAMNHLGLWIIVFAGSLGSGDLERLRMYVNEGQTIWYAYDAKQEPRELPFKVKLLDFDIKNYPPKLALIEQPEMKVPEDVKNNFSLVETGKKYTLGDWEVTVKEFLPSARQENGIFIASEDTFNVPAALIDARNIKNGNTINSWISCGNFMHEPVFMILDNFFALAMTNPEAKEFSSMLEVTRSDATTETIKLRVNDPVHVGAWNLYQTGYDDEKGKWSTLSIIEVIRDPWLFVIYLGIFMVIAGALYLFWIGRNPKN